jgi:hypothetical protein
MKKEIKMKPTKTLLAVGIAAVFAVSCAKNSEEESVDPCQKLRAEGGMCGDYTENITFPANSTITMRGPIKIKAGATLTIGAGSTLKADTSTLTYLLIERGASINAVGTAASPIVFTSGAPAGSRNPSDWGGIVIHGKSATNNTASADYATDSEIFTGPYGCGDAGNACVGTLGNNDNSGTLKYVRVEFAGREIASGKEFNGIFLAGVGKGTTIDHIQVHRGSDDGIEIFGGAVDIRYALITNNQDDAFDVDEGWRGTAQYVVAAVPKDGDQGIEYDGIGADASRATNVPLSNFTIVGSINKTVPGAISVRASGTMSLYNSYIAHFGNPNGIIAVADNSVCLGKNSATNNGTTDCTGSPVTPDSNYVGAAYNLRFESNFVECIFDQGAFTTAKTTLDSLFCSGNQPAGCSASSFNNNGTSGTNQALNTVGRFPDSTGTGNNDTSGLNCAAPKLNRPGDNVLWGVTSGINELRPTAAITATFTNPQAAPNGTDMPAPTYIGAFQNQTDHWGDANMNWVSFPAN